MHRHVAFLRAINTPPRYVKMERLRTAFGELGFRDTRTWIASGNVIFDSDTPDVDIPRIERHLEASLDFVVPVYLRTAEEVRSIVDHTPFGDERAAEVEVSLLPTPPGAGAIAEVLAMSNQTDELVFRDRELYWLYRSELGASQHSEPRVARALGMPTTRRAWSTIRTIANRFL